MSDTLADIAEAADALTDPRHHAEPRWEWDANRNRKPLPAHRTTVPGLIQQLRDATEPGESAESSGGSTAGLLPGDINAVSLLASIEHGARWRCLAWGVAGRTTAEDHIRGLVGAVGRRNSDEAIELRAELQSWRRQAEVITGWRTPSRPLNAPCPACDANGSLLARVDAEDPSAVCTACGERWDAETIGILARHVIDYQEKSAASRAAARLRAVQDRRRREGRAEAA